VKSLDRILADIGSPVDLVKFDIEGIEHKVFSDLPWCIRLIGLLGK
jgi:hypothetical protein